MNQMQQRSMPGHLVSYLSTCLLSCRTYLPSHPKHKASRNLGIAVPGCSSVVALVSIVKFWVKFKKDHRILLIVPLLDSLAETCIAETCEGFLLLRNFLLLLTNCIIVYRMPGI